MAQLNDLLVLGNSNLLGDVTSFGTIKAVKFDGPATSADKLNVNAGSATQPVYFKNGVPTATTYALNATVPSGAVFTDTKVTQAAAITTAGNYPILLGYQASTAAVTNTVNKAAALIYNPSTKAFQLNSGGAIFLRRNTDDNEVLKLQTEANNGAITVINETTQSVLKLYLQYNDTSNSGASAATKTITFTGNADGSHIALAGTNPYLSFANSAGTTVGYLQFVDTSATDYFAFGANASKGLQIDTSGNVSVPASTNLTPRTTNATTPSGSLGTSSQTWNTGYIKNLHIYGSASATMTADSTNPRITFSENGSQPVHLMYTDYDTYRTPAGLKIIGGSNASPAWFEVEGDIYAGNKFIQTKTENSATHTMSADCYSINFNSTTTGGWARAIKWLNSGSVKGQFGGFGSDDKMTYLFFGPEYNDTNFRVYNGTGKIAIRNTTSKPAAGVDLPVLNVQYQNTGSGTYYDTDIISVVGVGETGTTINNAFVRMGSTSGNLALTAGESAKTFIAKKADSTSSYYEDGWINTESMYMITDGQIRMYVGCNNTSGAGTNVANFSSDRITFNKYLQLSNNTYYASEYFQPTNSADVSGVVYYFIGAKSSDTTYTKARFAFRQYSYTDGTATRLSGYDQYELPAVTAGQTSTPTYSILTSRDVVTVAQGGTGTNTTSSNSNRHIANRLVWSNSNATILRASDHYADATHVAIKSTSQPDYNFYVNGSTGLNGSITIANASAYGTEAQRKAITSPKTGQVFFQLL